MPKNDILLPDMKISSALKVIYIKLLRVKRCKDRNPSSDIHLSCIFPVLPKDDCANSEINQIVFSRISALPRISANLLGYNIKQAPQVSPHHFLK